MIQHFAPLFTVAVQHSYYAGECEDFEYYMPAATSTVLRGARMLVRVTQGRLHVLFEADAAGAPIIDLAGRRLLFGLQLANASFDNFTVPTIGDAKRTPFFANDDDPAALDPPVGVTLASGVFEYAPRTAARPLTLVLSNSAGAVIESKQLPDGVFGHSFDLRGLSDGEYRVDEDPGGGSVARTRLFVSPELHGACLWGLIAIRIDAAFYTAPAAFTLAFSARAEQLKYYVVASEFTAAEFDQLSVADGGFHDEGRPQIDFDKVLPEEFSANDISPSLLGDAGSRIVMFRSVAAVVRREQGYRKIQLSRNGDVLLNNLPLPAANKPQAHFVIHLSKLKP